MVAPAFSVSVGGVLSRSGRTCGPRAEPSFVGCLRDYSLTTWGLAEGLSSSAIWAIVQTEEGYLWLGTDAGPVRFDGVRFVPWEALGLPPLPSVAVRALSSTRDGSVWFGFGAPGGVIRLHRGRDPPLRPQ